jgi:YD repeat-containing protein
MVSATKSSPPEPEYAWDVARLYPPQGMWSQDEYLHLTDETNNLVEFTNGHVEVLEMPTEAHQMILQFLNGLLLAFVSKGSLGRVLFAPLRIRLRPGVIREPDIVFMKTENDHRRHQRTWDGADLVIEIVSEDRKSRERDYIDKRRDYAEAGIPEYWIVDPQEQRITVLKLTGHEYSVHGEFTPGQTASSSLLPGFEVSVAAVFAAAS